MTALVVGAAGTIGQACVLELISSKQEVVAADLNEPAIPGSVSATVDVSDLSSVEKLIEEIEQRSPISSMIYAAGVNFTGHLDATDWQQYQKLMAVNLQGAFHFGAAIEKALKQKPRDFASVFISSTAGLRGEAGGSVYVATKFGLRGFVESFAAEIAQFGGRSNSVCPGNVNSPMLSKLAQGVGKRVGKSEAEILEEFAAASAFNRLIEPAEVARTCLWLNSPVASAISGQTIVVDGPPR